MSLFKPAVPMTDQEVMQMATDIASKHEQSGFTTTETLASWIAVAMRDAAKKAKDAEHDRIEIFIGTRKATEIRSMIQRCKLKWGK